MAYRTERISFRFLALTEQMVADLLTAQPGVKSRSSYNRPGCFTGVFALEEGKDYDWICSFIAKYGISEGDHDIFVSLSTDSDSAIVSVPAFAMRLSCRVAGGMTFSFTVLSEE